MSMTRPLVQAQSICIALLDSDNDNNYGNDDDECWQQGRGCKHPAFLHHVVQRWGQQQLWQSWWWMSTTRLCAQAHRILISRCAKAMTTRSIDDDERRVSDDKASCVSAQHICHCVQTHMLGVKHRCNKQPGNVKLRYAWATLSNIDDLVHKRTRLSSLVPKRMSYSVKHRCNNQPFQCQA